jgi:hypothetical protein
MYKKIDINGKESLPQEGKYEYVMIKDTPNTNRGIIDLAYSKSDNKEYWLTYVDWYLQPLPQTEISDMVVGIVCRYWKFDSEQQHLSSWHDKQDCIVELRSQLSRIEPEKEQPEIISVFTVQFNPCTHESCARTLSIHLTQKEAEMTLDFEKNRILKERGKTKLNDDEVYFVKKFPLRIKEQPVSEPTIDINTPFFGNTGAKVPVSEPESCDHDFVSGCDGKIYCQKCPEVRIVNQENNKSISAEEWLENKMNDLNDKPKGENSFEDWYLMDYSFTLRTISEWMEEYTKLKSGGK